MLQPMAVPLSRPTSPPIPTRALDPVSRPPSRCESLLRDTLRRADQHDRGRYRSVSRSPVRWSSDRRPAPSHLASNGPTLAAPIASSAYSDYDCEELAFSSYARPPLHNALHRTPSFLENHPEHYYYAETHPHQHDGSSHASPSRTPHLMVRALTAPVLPRSSASFCGDENVPYAPYAPHSPPSPLQSRRSLTCSAIGSAGPQSMAHSVAASVESSPKQLYHAISPHESALRAKLESVLLKAGAAAVTPSAGSSGSPPDEAEFDGQRRRYYRTYSSNVAGSPPCRFSPGEFNATLPSPQSLSNSAIDLAKADNIYFRRYTTNKPTLSSPAEPITPPPTPPTMAFNPQAASELCKRIDGYVSFSSIEGLGEPPGMDSDDEDSDEGIRRWSKWWRRLPFVQGQQSPSDEQESSAGYLARGRHRSNSAVSR